MKRAGKLKRRTGMKRQAGMKRQTGMKRKTRETDIRLGLDLGAGRAPDVRCPVPFLGHMLELMSAHGGLGLVVRASGDTEVDDHHLAEDLGICLGQALARALGPRKGIRRYGSAVVPMDEALVMAAVDISGRAHLSYGLRPGARRIKGFSTDLVEEFLLGLARNVPMTIHMVQFSGRNAHHVVEAGFKALGRALGEAFSPDSRFKGVPSTKGRL